MTAKWEMSVGDDRIQKRIVIAIIIAIIGYLVWQVYDVRTALSEICELSGDHVASMRNPITTAQKIDTLCLSYRWEDD